ncbi:MAG: CarD family transcriptional regulator [Acidiferrobacterales bacterium]
MRKRQHNFKVGDTVFYPSAGVGIIENVEDVFISGRCDPCFVIRIAETQMTVKIPHANVNRSGLRPLLSIRKIKDLFRILSAKGNQRVTGGNWTDRCRELERKINSGSCLELGEVVRDLMRWKKQSGLSFEESMLLKTASIFLANEVAAVQGIPAQDAIDSIRNHVEVRAA